jgi:glycosyltransferase involved in cell wall biosynthesis
MADSADLVEIEALLSGTPVVVTDIPGARVVIRETAFGRLVQPGDPAALASGIVEILRAPDRYRPSQEAVRRVFDTQQTITHYEQLLDGRETPELEKQAIEQHPSVSVAGSLR